MHVSLTPKLEELVRRKVKSGLYNNASEVVREALRLMAAQDQTYQRKLKELRAAVAEGMRSPIVEDFSFEKLKAELDAEAAKLGIRE
ncbi:MAG: type II toxin-antitoxin system ParD family antitoxin [Rhodospirillales bacterium]